MYNRYCEVGRKCSKGKRNWEGEERGKERGKKKEGKRRKYKIN